jgi:hypothetical protein
MVRKSIQHVQTEALPIKRKQGLDVVGGAGGADRREVVMVAN